MLKQLIVSDGSNTRVNSNYRVNGVAVFLFIIFLLLAILGSIIMENNDVSQTVTTPYLIIMILLGVYILLALQVASQWDKASKTKA